MCVAVSEISDNDWMKADGKDAISIFYDRNGSSFVRSGMCPSACCKTLGKQRGVREWGVRRRAIAGKCLPEDQHFRGPGMGRANQRPYYERSVRNRDSVSSARDNIRFSIFRIRWLGQSFSPDVGTDRRWRFGFSLVVAAIHRSADCPRRVICVSWQQRREANA